MEIFESIALLAISFAATFCTMEIIWRLHLRARADEKKQDEKPEYIAREKYGNDAEFPSTTYA
jgi:hypothetical protein